MSGNTLNSVVPHSQSGGLISFQLACVVFPSVLQLPTMDGPGYEMLTDYMNMNTLLLLEERGMYAISTIRWKIELNTKLSSPHKQVAITYTPATLLLIATKVTLFNSRMQCRMWYLYMYLSQALKFT